MRKIILTLLSIAAAFQMALVALPISSVHAQSPLGDSTKNLSTFGGTAGYGTATDGSQLMVTIGNIIKFALGFMGIIFVLLIIYAGFLWMTAGGDSKKVDQSKSIIKNCIIGLVIMVMAYSITTFVFANLGKATGG